MSTPWPRLPPYQDWRATCDTLHAHTQLLGKLSATLAPPEPQLQHAALRLTARGWETAPLPAPDDSGALVVALDLRAHEVVVEHSHGRGARIPLTPNRSVGSVTREVLATLQAMVGAVDVRLQPQEVPWDVPLDEDEEHRTFDPADVVVYFAAATRAAQVLAALRAPYRGRSSPVNAWWGTFDLAISLFSGRSAEPSSDDFIMRNSGDAQQVEVGWWPGDARYPWPAFFSFASPAPPGFSEGTVTPEASRWDGELGEYLLDWADVIESPEPHADALGFGRSSITHACNVCDWDPVLASSVRSVPPPVH
jgi:Family of unknown function (DUF5996)